MGVYFYNGKVLFEDGKVAMSVNCCCDYVVFCSPCPDEVGQGGWVWSWEADGKVHSSSGGCVEVPAPGGDKTLYDPDIHSLITLGESYLTCEDCLVADYMYIIEIENCENSSDKYIEGSPFSLPPDQSPADPVVYKDDSDRCWIKGAVAYDVDNPPTYSQFPYMLNGNKSYLNCPACLLKWVLNDCFEQDTYYVSDEDIQSAGLQAGDVIRVETIDPDKCFSVALATHEQAAAFTSFTPLVSPIKYGNGASYCSACKILYRADFCPDQEGESNFEHRWVMEDNVPGGTATLVFKDGHNDTGEYCWKVELNAPMTLADWLAQPTSWRHKNEISSPKNWFATCEQCCDNKAYKLTDCEGTLPSIYTLTDLSGYVAEAGNKILVIDEDSEACWQFIEIGYDKTVTYENVEVVDSYDSCEECLAEELPLTCNDCPEGSDDPTQAAISVSGSLRYDYTMTTVSVANSGVMSYGTGTGVIKWTSGTFSGDGYSDLVVVISCNLSTNNWAVIWVMMQQVNGFDVFFNGESSVTVTDCSDGHPSLTAEIPAIGLGRRGTLLVTIS